MNLLDVAACLKVLREHACFISDRNQEEMEEQLATWWSRGDDADVANLAIRTCLCGARIDGFDEYHAHLEEEVKKLSGVTT